MYLYHRIQRIVVGTSLTWFPSLERCYPFARCPYCSQTIADVHSIDKRRIVANVLANSKNGILIHLLHYQTEEQQFQTWRRAVDDEVRSVVRRIHEHQEFIIFVKLRKMGRKSVIILILIVLTITIVYWIRWEKGH